MGVAETAAYSVLPVHWNTEPDRRIEPRRTSVRWGSVRSTKCRTDASAFGAVNLNTAPTDIYRTEPIFA